MKCLITSDVHGNLEALKDIVKKHKDIDYHFDAGDMCLDPKRYEHMHIISVKGNNDFGIDLPWIRILDLGTMKVLLTHGHLESVKFGYEKLKLKAKLHGATLCIFGHTHQRYLSIEDGIIFVNPGALGDYHKSYALYDNQQVYFMER